MKTEKRIYEKAFLIELVKDKYSCLILKSCTRRIELQPKYLKEVKVGIKEALDQCLNKYDYSLNGILLDYQNVSVKVDKNSGKIVGKCGEFVVSVIGEFFVFQPDIGNLLKGVVNVKSESHVGCLVHKRFNAMILKPDDVEIENWNCRNVQIGDEIVFEIADHVFSGHVPFIEGKISGEYLEKKLRKKLKKSRRTTSGEHSQHNGHCTVEDELLKNEKKKVSIIDEEHFDNSIVKNTTFEELEKSLNISPKKKESEVKLEEETDIAQSDHRAKKKMKKKDKDGDKDKDKDKNKHKHKSKSEDKYKDEDKAKSKEKEKESTKKKSEKKKSLTGKKDEIEVVYNVEISPSKSKKSQFVSGGQVSLDECWKSESHSVATATGVDRKRNVKEIDSEPVAKETITCTPVSPARKRVEDKIKKPPAKKAKLETDDGLRQRLIYEMLQSKLTPAEDKFDKPLTTSTPKTVDDNSQNVDKKDACTIGTPKAATPNKKRKRSSKSKSELSSHKCEKEGEEEEERKLLIKALLDNVKLSLGIKDVAQEKIVKPETKNKDVKDVDDPIFQWLRKSADKPATQQVQKCSKGDVPRLSSADSGFNSLADKFKN